MLHLQLFSSITYLPTNTPCIQAAAFQFQSTWQKNVLLVIHLLRRKRGCFKPISIFMEPRRCRRLIHSKAFRRPRRNAGFLQIRLIQSIPATIVKVILNSTSQPAIKQASEQAVRGLREGRAKKGRKESSLAVPCLATTVNVSSSPLLPPTRPTPKAVTNPPFTLSTTHENGLPANGGKKGKIRHANLQWDLGSHLRKGNFSI